MIDSFARLTSGHYSRFRLRPTVKTDGADFGIINEFLMPSLVKIRPGSYFIMYRSSSHAKMPTSENLNNQVIADAQ